MCTSFYFISIVLGYYFDLNNLKNFIMSVPLIQNICVFCQYSEIQINVNPKYILNVWSLLDPFNITKNSNKQFSSHLTYIWCWIKNSYKHIF